uniref:Uncharacterized protein n=1 Tax=Lepeophtheirus salmonis TaxID=72036 RepID=A0A0K2V7D9_LEPSM
MTLPSLDTTPRAMMGWGADYSFSGRFGLTLVDSPVVPPVDDFIFQLH